MFGPATTRDAGFLSKFNTKARGRQAHHRKADGIARATAEPEFRFRYSIACKIGLILCIDLGALVIQLDIAMYTNVYK